VGGEGRVGFLATLLPESGLWCCSRASQEEISIANQDLYSDKTPAILNGGKKGARHESEDNHVHTIHFEILMSCFLWEEGAGKKRSRALSFPTSMFL